MITAPIRRVGDKEEDFEGVRFRRKFWGGSQGRGTSEDINACLTRAQNGTAHDYIPAVSDSSGENYKRSKSSQS